MISRGSVSNVSPDAAAARALVLEDLARERELAWQLLERSEIWATHYVQALDLSADGPFLPESVRAAREACRVHLTELRAYLAGDLTAPRSES